MRPKILIISPIRNEGAYIERTIQSLIQQKTGIQEWIIVDDNSTDNSASIIQRYAKRHSWIHYLKKPGHRHRHVGGGVVDAFNYGLKHVKNKDYDYICKMDGDITFGPNYITTLLNIFKNDSKLGAASGKFYDGEAEKRLSRTSDDMVVGAFNFYRRTCYESIGGFVQEVMWDGIAFHRARMQGWKTRSIDHPDLNFVHLRPMGSSQKSIYVGRLRWGRGQYFMGTHPLYMLCIFLFRSVEKPYFIGGFLILLGYLWAWARRLPRYENPAFRQSLHAWQYQRVIGLLKLNKKLL